MKKRNGFVSNSSSSSYIVDIRSQEYQKISQTYFFEGYIEVATLDKYTEGDPLADYFGDDALKCIEQRGKENLRVISHDWNIPYLVPRNSIIEDLG